MRLLLPLLLLCAAGAGATDPPAADVDRLISRTRTLYAQTSTFSPTGLRFPLRKDAAADLTAARRAAADAPDDLEAQWKLAELAEQVEAGDGDTLWARALALVEVRLKSSATPDLAERRVRGFVGANLALQAVPAAEKLVAAQPGSWRAHLLHGDACLRRADFNWRVLVRLRRGKPELPAGPLLQMNGDLAACAKAYDRAVELAPAEQAPRGARIALRVARPFMATLLPKGVIPDAERPDVRAVHADLIELVRRTPGQTAPLWHATLFFAAQASEEAPLSMSQREVLEKGLAEARPEPAGDDRVFLAEARGLLAFVRQDWAGVRKQFDAALTLAPERVFAAEWLALAESESAEPREQVLARARARIAVRPRSQDWALAGILLAEENRSEAVQALRKALDLNVDDANARYNLGVLLFRVYRSTNEARRNVERSLQLQPDNREAVFVLTLMQIVDGDREGGRRSLAELVKLPDLDPDLRARCQATLDDLGKAKE